MTDDTRCTGHYQDAKVGLGREIDPQCVGCARRVPVIHGDGKRWMTVPVMSGVCPMRIFNAKGN